MKTEEEITITEVKQLKLKLEENILNLVIDFQKKTGVSLAELNLYQEYTTINDIEFVTGTEIKTKITLEL